MTRKHFEAIARALRFERPDTDDTHGFALWLNIVEQMADTLSDLAGLTANGNRRFDRDRFVEVCLS